MLLVIGLLLGCANRAQNQEILLYCGAGLRPCMEEVVAQAKQVHGLNIVADYAGSETLLSRIRLSQKGDLYLPGDRRYMDLAREAGLIRACKPVCLFKPVLFVQKGNPKGIHGLQDLLKPNLRCGFGDPKACAIGLKTRKILEKNKIPWDQMEANVRFLSLTVNELGLQIQAQTLDAVIVWDAMARCFEDWGEIIPIKPEENLISHVDLGLLECSENRTQARLLYDFITSKRSRAVFKKHGYALE